jgi:hypothetical protein
MPRYLRTAAYTLVMLGVIVALGYRWRPAPPAPAGDDEPAALHVEEVEATLAALGARVAAEPRTAVVLGDSSLLGHRTLPPDETLAVMLEQEGARADVPLQVFAAPGFDAVAYYTLADALAALHPAAVVLVANLQAFSDSWFRNLKIKHPDLVAFVRPTRALEVIALPLDEAGISDASALTMPMLRWLGAPELPATLRDYRDAFRARLDGAGAAPVPARLPAFAPGARRPSAEGGRGGKRVRPRPPAGDAEPGALPPRLGPKAQRERGGKRLWPLPPVSRPRPAAATDAAGDRLPPPAGLGQGPHAAPAKRAGSPRPAPGARRPRGTGTWATSPFRRLDLYPSALARGAPAVEVMAAAVRAFTAHGLRTIVVLAPLHLQALRLTGAYDRRHVADAVDLVRAASLENGAEVVDLTEALPEESYFSDAYTHFTAEGNRLVASMLVPRLSALLPAVESRPAGAR